MTNNKGRSIRWVYFCKEDDCGVIRLCGGWGFEGSVARGFSKLNFGSRHNQSWDLISKANNFSSKRFCCIVTLVYRNAITYTLWLPWSSIVTFSLYFFNTYSNSSCIPEPGLYLITNCCSSRVDHVIILGKLLKYFNFDMMIKTRRVIRICTKICHIIVILIDVWRSYR